MSNLDENSHEQLLDDLFGGHSAESRLMCRHPCTQHNLVYWQPLFVTCCSSVGASSTHTMQPCLFNNTAHR